MFQRQPLDLEAKLYFIENKMTLECENVFIELGVLQGLLITVYDARNSFPYKKSNVRVTKRSSVIK